MEPRSALAAERFGAIRRTLLVVLGVDLLLAALKGLYGYATGSLGMVADGLHSALHAAGSVVALFGVALAARPPDTRHPYGYERYEPLAAMGIAGLMLLAVWRILAGAWTRFWDSTAPTVTIASFAIMAAAILVTIALAGWERRRARVLSSAVLGADSSRIWGDTLVSASVTAGLLALRAGWAWLDAFVSLAVAGVVARTAWRIVRDASEVLTDAAMADTSAVTRAALSVAGVRGCHRVRARGGGGIVRVDLHVLVDSQMTVAESHALVREVERRVRKEVPGTAEVLVHVGPSPGHQDGDEVQSEAS